MTFRSYLSPHKWKAQLVFWGGAILVGLVSALFALGSEQAYNLFNRMESQASWLPLIITPAGLVLIAWLTRRYFPGTQGSGIPQAIAALEMRPQMHYLRRSILSLRIAFGKIFLTLLGLLCGASIGREGPTVHIGAAIMYTVGHYAHFPRHYLDKSLIIAGGAAGIAAAFNTPLAGIVFAIEEMARSFEERTSGTLLTAVVIAGITAMGILGNYTYFGTSHASLQLGSGWIIIPVVGITGGLLGGLFARTLVSGSRWVAPHLSRHPLLIPALCGLVVALAGILSGGTIYGTGYPEAQAALSGEGEAGLLFPAFKIIATVASYLSGIPGGIFAPSLATGAGLGAVMAELFSGPGMQAIVILTMVAYFTGVVQTPITAFVIVMEMTDNHTMLLPLMATAFIAYGASRLVCHEPIYRSLAQGFLDRLRAEEPNTAGTDKPGNSGRA
ncbi:MAG: chloride channel protein [Gammaproteobacteria bacterium]|nr:chloride channel protein [Gammaproteobacteria bacterium]